MELTESKIKYLLNGENINKLNSETFEQVMKIAVHHACGKSDTEVLTRLYGSKPDVVKSAFADIIKLLIEATRYDISLANLNNLLKSTSLSNSYIDKFCEFYEKYKQQVQENLESVGNSLPHIVDVDWQIDYCIKSSLNSSAGVINYTVSLSCIKYGKIESVKFVCTIQQLQELVLKLRDAARHIEKLTNP